jgi:hypothetical protein
MSTNNHKIVKNLSKNGQKVIKKSSKTVKNCQICDYIISKKSWGWGGGSKSDSKAFGRLLCSRPKAKSIAKLEIIMLTFFDCGLFVKLLKRSKCPPFEKRVSVPLEWLGFMKKLSLSTYVKIKKLHFITCVLSPGVFTGCLKI